MGVWWKTSEIVLAALTAQVSPAPTPQTRPAKPPQSTAPTDAIVVEGLRDIDDPKSAVTHRTLGSGRVGKGARQNREAFQMAQRFADCALKNQNASNMERLRKALDGVINGAGQRFWQSRFIQQQAACAQDVGIAQRLGVAMVSNVTSDPSYYERGALYVAVLRTFAPELKLTKAETGDPAVQGRFDAREVPLARFRLPVDRTYFQAAVCLVRLQPELSVRLVRADSADTIARIEAAIVNGGKICVGNARQVYFDPSQFRLYIADAVYRWAIAAKGVDSLIPAG